MSRRKRLTLQQAWRDYREAPPEGYGYSQGSELYRASKARWVPVTLQEHKVGEKLFVDYTSRTGGRNRRGRRLGWSCIGTIGTRAGRIGLGFAMSPANGCRRRVRQENGTRTLAAFANGALTDRLKEDDGQAGRVAPLAGWTATSSFRG